MRFLAFLLAFVALAAISTANAAPTLAWQSTFVLPPGLGLFNQQERDFNDIGTRTGVDAAGNLYVAATSSAEASSCVHVLKFSTADGSLLWNRPACAPGLTSFGAALAIDDAGRVHVAGALGGELYVAKLTPDATTLWERRIPRTTEAMHAALAIALTRSGEVRVGGQRDGVIVVHALRGDDGVPQWETALDPALGTRLRAFACDAEGNTALFDRRTIDLRENVADVVTRLHASGILQWERAMGGIQDQLAFDAAGDLFSAGVTGLNKLAAATGAPLWNQPFTAPIRVDSRGNVFAMSRVAVGGQADIAAYKIAPSGALLWSSEQPDPSNFASIRVAALDSQGQLIGAGNQSDASGTFDQFTLGIGSADGRVAWRADSLDTENRFRPLAVHAGSGFALVFGNLQRRSDDQLFGLRILKYQGTEVTAPQVRRLAIVPGDIDFGVQSMGTTSPARTLTLTNTGDMTVTVSGLTASNAAFAVGPGCATIAPATSCSASITFTPPAAEGALGTTVAIEATLTVASDAEGGPGTIFLAGTGEKSLVAHYYRAILGRDADAQGHAFWQAEATRLRDLGADVNEVWFAMARAFFASAEYRAQPRDDTAFVGDLYRAFFNRAPDASGLAFWKARLADGLPREVALVAFMLSPEFTGFSRGIFGDAGVRPEVNAVLDVYRGLLGRLPEDSGYAFWLGRFRAAQCAGAEAVRAEADAITRDFTASAEYAQRQRTASQYVGDLYDTFLRRGGDTDGVRFWIDEIESGRQSREAVRRFFLASPEFSRRVDAIIAAGCQR